MIQVTFTRNFIGMEDLLLGVGTVLQTRGTTENVPVTKINGALFPYDDNFTMQEKFDALQFQIDNLPVIVDQFGNMLSGLIDTSALDLSPTHTVPGRLWRKTVNPNLAEIYYGSELILQYDPMNGNLITDATAYIAADAVVTAAYIAADAVVTAAFQAADAQLTLDYIAADALITAAYIAADVANAAASQAADLAIIADYIAADAVVTAAYQAAIAAAIVSANTLAQSKYSENTTATTILTTIPDDDTIPQITEGGQIFSQTITPASATSRIRITANIWGSKQDGVGADGVCAALFVDGATNAIAAAGHRPGVATDYADGFNITLVHEYVPGDTALHTFTVRVGAGTQAITINGKYPSRKYGGVAKCTLLVEEYAP